MSSQLTDGFDPDENKCGMNNTQSIARLLHDRLQGQGNRCWSVEQQLLLGDDLHEGIDRSIRLWDRVLNCTSQASFSSGQVDGELKQLSPTPSLAASSLPSTA